MPKKPKAVVNVSPATYDDDASYDVVLRTSFNRNGVAFLPRHHHEMTGRFLNKLAEEGFADAIDNATRRK